MRKFTLKEEALWKEVTAGAFKHQDDHVDPPLRGAIRRLRRSQDSTSGDFCGQAEQQESSPKRESQRILEAAYGHVYGVERLPQNKARTIWPEATLDLHGLTQAQAVPRLQTFLYESQALGRQWVKVITGKSGIFFVLMPRYLLANAPFVSGYLHARARDGGSGALYVRIRKLR